VATALGVLTGLSPWVGLSVLGTWVAMAFAFRISSGCLDCGIAFALYLWFLTHSLLKVGAGVAMALLLTSRHRGNIERLVRGEESRIGGARS
jgi:glycerol-3-phosphate acyltransferase PlsY